MDELKELEIRTQQNGQVTLPPRIDDVQMINILVKQVKSHSKRLEELESSNTPNYSPTPEKAPKNDQKQKEEPFEDFEGKYSTYRIDNMTDNGWQVHFTVDGFKSNHEAREWAKIVDEIIKQDTPNG